MSMNDCSLRLEQAEMLTVKHVDWIEVRSVEI